LNLTKLMSFILTSVVKYDYTPSVIREAS
jgi:hypothetical protein